MSNNVLLFLNCNMGQMVKEEIVNLKFECGGGVKTQMEKSPLMSKLARRQELLGLKITKKELFGE